MKDFLQVLQDNYQAQIAGFYNVDKTDLEKAKRSAVIEEYQDLIAIYKSNSKIKDKEESQQESSRQRKILTHLIDYHDSLKIKPKGLRDLITELQNELP